MLQVLRPLITFEAQRQATNPRAHWVRWGALLLAGLFLVVAQFHAMTAGGLSLVGSGQGMLSGLAWLNYVFILVACLGLFATAVTNERESGTLPLLVVADIPFRPFVCGKWAQFLFPAALIVLLELPLLAGATFFGGVTYDQVVASAGLLTAFLFFSSTAGMLFSVVFHTSNRAAFACLVVVGVVEFGPVAADQLLTAQSRKMINLGTGLSNALNWGVEHSGASVFEALRSTFIGGSATQNLSRIAASTIGIQIGLGLLCAGGAVLLAPRLSRAVEGTASELRKEIHRSSRRVVGEPVRWKEFFFHVHGWAGLAFRILAYVLATIATVAVLNRFKLSDRDSWTTLALILALIGLIDLAGMASRIFGAEQRQQTLSTLLLVSHRSADLFWKKVLGLLPACLVAASVLILANAIRPEVAGSWERQTWIVAMFTVASIALWLQLIVLSSLDFPSISLFVATIGLFVIWIFASVVAAVWLLAAGADSDGDSMSIAITYLLALVTCVAHVVATFRVSDAAAK